MLFHQDGYVSGDPRRLPARGTGLTPRNAPPTACDVVVVGAGPAGLITAAQLSRFCELSVCLIESRAGRLEVGHADGVQVRTVETLHYFGISDELEAEAQQMTFTSFWAGSGGIERTAVVPDDPDGMSDFPHLIVNQARVQDYFVRYLRRSESRLGVDYGYSFVDVSASGDVRHPVTVTLREAGGAIRTVSTRFVLGADGARSAVRSAIGQRLTGTDPNHAWGVVDCLVDTDFPDYRRRCIIQADDIGSLMIIPREGGFLVRLYVDLGDLTDANAHVRDTPLDEILARAAEILAPFRLDVVHVAWWSVYEVAQRIADRFSGLPAVGTESAKPLDRVYIMGDACHTHSAKAGQGMNVSMQDGFNLAWKVGYVATGRGRPELLRSYESERRPIAEQLLEFDRMWSNSLAHGGNTGEKHVNSSRIDGGATGDPIDGVDRAVSGQASSTVSDYLRSRLFTTGLLTTYNDPMLTRVGRAGLGFEPGRRFRASSAIRCSDLVPMCVGDDADADGRWRAYVFVASLDPVVMVELGKWSFEFEFMLSRYCDATAPSGSGSIAEATLVVNQPADTVAWTGVPLLFRPRKGRFNVVDATRVFGTGPSADPFAERGISESVCVLVRPDMYVSGTFALTETRELAAFLDGVLMN